MGRVYTRRTFVSELSTLTATGGILPLAQSLLNTNSALSPYPAGIPGTCRR